MNILFRNWIIDAAGDLLARQNDNLSRSLVVTGDLPEGWDWYLLLSTHGKFDASRLSPMDGGVGVILTDAQLAYSGQYDVQLRGVQGETVLHTNVIQVDVSRSLSGSCNWPTIPSEFTQIEARMRDLLAESQLAKDNAAADREAAQAALQGMTYVTFNTDANGHVLIRNGDLLGSTAFDLIPADATTNAGHLEVNY